MILILIHVYRQPRGAAGEGWECRCSWVQPWKSMRIIQVIFKVGIQKNDDFFGLCTTEQLL